MSAVSIDHRPTATPRRSARSGSRRTKSPSLTKSSLTSSSSFTTAALSSSLSSSAPESSAKVKSSSSSSSSSTVSKTSLKHRALSPEPSTHRLHTQVFDSESGTGFELSDITRKIINTIEGLTGARLDVMYLELFGIVTGSSSDDKSSEDGDDKGDRDVHEEEERQVEKELLAVNGRGHTPIVQRKVEKTGKAEKKKIDWEIPRKALHSSIGFLTLYLYLSPHTPTTVVRVLWAALCIIAPADYLRLRKGEFAERFERVYEKAVGWLMREGEKNSTNGVIWYILGVNFALTFYPLDVAVVGILILSWADTAASTFGRLWAGHWGYYTPRLPARLPLIPFISRFSLAGFLAASLTGATIAFGFWGWIVPMRGTGASTSVNGMPDATWTLEGGLTASPRGSGAGGWIEIGVLALWAGLVSGVAEALDLGSMDDNLTLPIISGACLWAFFGVLGWIRG
ncbi:hypothetical protein GYMLUDRAFT_182012 [Collybiopsis luxurians FD-317 M1]|uniref:Phosphatidate cytidylyltransferase n=1 Tax=Collybiopsis luxurians FD-317 M1 TaxID=944289 RepID=A0A0D0BNB2_9AGAR|nr:hypothetical protein GYMLUDRAFT_182012 [Collybiopsis luxurians FD-317 M1]